MDGWQFRPLVALIRAQSCRVVITPVKGTHDGVDKNTHGRCAGPRNRVQYFRISGGVGAHAIWSSNDLENHLWIGWRDQLGCGRLAIVREAKPFLIAYPVQDGCCGNNE